MCIGYHLASELSRRVRKFLLKYNADELSMNQAERIAEMFGNDGMNFILRGEFETKTLDEVCMEFMASKDRGRVGYDENGLMQPDFDPEGDMIRYSFKDGSAIVISCAAWDIEGDAPFTWESNQ